MARGGRGPPCRPPLSEAQGGFQPAGPANKRTPADVSEGSLTPAGASPTLADANVCTALPTILRIAAHQSSRTTTRVLIGSFIAARRRASRAVSSSTPSSSNMTRPGFTLQAQ